MRATGALPRRRAWLLLGMLLAALACAHIARAACTSGVVINSACVVQGDLRGVLPINAASLNQVYSVLLDGGRGSAGWQISGLTASGATLTPVWSDDGVTWNNGTVIASGAPATTLAGDGAATQDAAHHVAVGFKVSVAGTGTILAAYSVTVNAMDPVMRNALGSQSDGAWGGSGNGSAVAMLKAIAASLPNAIGTNGFDFTVTATDQALPVTGSPALTLPGKVCLASPQQSFGSVSLNTGYVNVNWYGASSVTSPIEQLAPGVGEVCRYVTMAPHVSLNSGSTNISIGVGQ